MKNTGGGVRRGRFHRKPLVKRLKKRGYWVPGVDSQAVRFSPTRRTSFLSSTFGRSPTARQAVRTSEGRPFDEVYQLVRMGGMGFIQSAECEIMRNSALINIHMTNAAATAGVNGYFFSSSACVYREHGNPRQPELSEAQATPRSR